MGGNLVWRQMQSSQIDYTFMPEELVKLSWGKRLYRSARRLQLVQARDRRDRIPVMTGVPYS
eukprot:1835166-Lingulodinium_polyedra.AAC.1